MEYVNKKFSNNKNKEVKKIFVLAILDISHTHIHIYLAYNYLAIEIKKDIF